MSHFSPSLLAISDLDRAQPVDEMEKTINHHTANRV